MIGECVCGSVRYVVSGKVTKLYQCHCTICQKQTGSASQTGFFVDLPYFEWLSGQDNICAFTKDSGYSVCFCKTCGSTLPNLFRTGDKYWVPAGAFKYLQSARVENHIFVANKAAWDEIPTGTTQHEGFYPVFLENP